MYYDDFAPGQVFQTTARTVTEADVVSFAGLSGDFSSMHVDQLTAEDGPHGKRIAHGLCVTSIVSGLLVQLRLWDESAVALLGISWRFQQAVPLGETIRATMTVEEMRVTNKGNRGVITFDIQVMAAEGAVVQQGKWTQMFSRSTEETK